MIAIPQCIPEPRFNEVSYHWVQWRTPHRTENPQPWFWDAHKAVWLTRRGIELTPEQAAASGWVYLEPLCEPGIETHDSVLAQLAQILTVNHFAARFGKDVADPLVQAAAHREPLSTAQAETIIKMLDDLGLRIR